MDKLNIKMENCYGIKKLDCTFDFSSENVHSIYAQNGIMKTSFARAFKDLSQGEDSSDLMFPSRKTVRKIMDGKKNIVSEEVFVIEPYDEDFNSDKVSSLLVKKELKEKYDKIHYELDLKKEEFLKRISKLSGLKKEIEEEINATFNNEDFYDCLERLEKEVSKSEPKYTNLPYSDVFNQKVIDFLEDPVVKGHLKEYIEQFNRLISESEFFEKGIFNHNNAYNVSKELKNEGFFKATHTVILNSKSGKKEIISEEEFNTAITKEKEKIFSDKKLSEKFDLIDNAIKKNKELRSFRSYIETNQEIIPELDNLLKLKKKIWISYLKKEESIFRDLLVKYKSGKKEIEEIVRKAKVERTEWEQVINIFNKRFFVPFKLSVVNKDDVILKDEVPTIGFTFKDSSGEVSTDRETLLNVLSGGEKRALYILNIIFEVEARKKASQKTLFIVDDIADSFDYKNKYAIIEYLKDISKEKSLFHEIILTHNFDFFRTLESRVIKYPCCHMIKKTDAEITLINATGIRNPFNNDWKINMSNNDIKLIASIPFVRNLIAYTKGESDANYLKLTSALHMKIDSIDLTISDLESIFKDELHNAMLSLPTGTRKVLDVIFKLADECTEAGEYPNLENKIVLSMAIRLKSDKYMLSQINDESKTSLITGNQTGELFKLFVEKFPQSDKIEILERVNLMTPENIHFNSFMYEPILDLSEKHLIDLYTDVKTQLI